ncbi:MAG: dienelactone hydrolase family protein [bacterium]
MRTLLALLFLAGVAHAGESPMTTRRLSEADFKALHALTGAAAPAPRGVMVDLGGGQAYLSLPPGATAPVPGVVVIHEWWGLNDHIKHWADRLADDGYAALAVDLYGGRVATTPDEAMAAMKTVDTDKASELLKKAVAFLGADPRVQAKKRAVIGWCFGGAWSLQTGLLAGADLAAVVMYYGRVEAEAAKLAGLQAPLLGIFANQDAHITPEAVNAFEAALKAAGKTATVLRFDADHAFANPSSARYDEVDAASAWLKVRAFLAEKLKG